MTGKEYVPAEASIVRMARAIKESEEGLWDFAAEYAALSTIPEFNYRALMRAVKDQHGVDLYPPYTATKLRKAYEKYVLTCKVKEEEIRRFSPFTLYDISTVIDVTPANVHEVLGQIKNHTRDDLIERLKAKGEGNKEPTNFLRVPESVYTMVKEATLRLGYVVNNKTLSTTVFLEFVSELVLNTEGNQLRRLWDAMHGDTDGKPVE